MVQKKRMFTWLRLLKLRALRASTKLRALLAASTLTALRRPLRRLPKPVLAGLAAAMGFVVAAALFGATGQFAGINASSTLAEDTGSTSSASSASGADSSQTWSEIMRNAPTADPSSLIPVEDGVEVPPDASGPDSASPDTTAPGTNAGNGAKSGTKQSAPRAAAPVVAAPAPVVPVPVPEPVATRCPDSQGEDPTMWAACRAGYSPPSITFGGIVSCSAIDRAAGTWAVTIRWNVSGGNYRGEIDTMPNGTNSFTITGVPVGALDEVGVEPPGWTVEMSMYSMNGLGGPLIDRVTSSPAGFVPMSSGCS